MLSGRLLMRYACKLHEWYEAGLLAGLGTAEVDMDDPLPLELAVVIALNDLDDLLDQAVTGPPPPTRRWQRLSNDIERLYRLAMDRLNPDDQAPRPDG